MNNISNIRKFPVFAVIVHAISNNKFVINFKSGIINLNFFDTASFFIQKCTNFN